jgi:flavin reductase (DIM6/NTAB) family NADH-FMN oxidoreductase RutF
VVLVGSGDGKLHPWNILTVAWAGTLSSDPPMVGIGVRPERFSYAQIEALKCFTVNVPTVQMAESVDYCGVASGRDIDKFKARQLTPRASSTIAAPIVEECPLSLECALEHSVNLGSHTLFIGRVKAVQVTSELINADGKLDLQQADLLAYAHGNYYALGRTLGKFGFSVKKR